MNSNHTNTIASVAFLIAFLGMCALAAGQSRPQLRPVDQAVEDLDGLAVSLRRMGKGIRSDGEQTSLFKYPQPAVGSALTRPYLHVAPGVIARIDRPDYLVFAGTRDKRILLKENVAPKVDGMFIEVIPPNTIFELRPLDQLIGPPTQAVAPQPSKYRIDTRLSPPPLLGDHRIDLRIDTKLTNKPPPLPTSKRYWNRRRH